MLLLELVLHHFMFIHHYKYCDIKSKLYLLLQGFLTTTHTITMIRATPAIDPITAPTIHPVEQDDDDGSEIGELILI